MPLNDQTGFCLVDVQPCTTILHLVIFVSQVYGVVFKHNIICWTHALCILQKVMCINIKTKGLRNERIFLMLFLIHTTHPLCHSGNKAKTPLTAHWLVVRLLTASWQEV